MRAGSSPVGDAQPPYLPDIRATVQLPSYGEPKPMESPAGVAVAEFFGGRGVEARVDALDEQDSGLGKSSREGL